MIFEQKLDFWPKFWFLTKISLNYCSQDQSDKTDIKLRFWTKVCFLNKLLVFGEVLILQSDLGCSEHCCQKLFRTKFWFFNQSFDFLPKRWIFSFLTKILFFDESFDFWPKSRFWMKSSIFPIFWFLTQKMCASFSQDFIFFLLIKIKIAAYGKLFYILAEWPEPSYNCHRATVGSNSSFRILA